MATTATQQPTGSRSDLDRPDRRWLVLAVIGIAQLMVVVDVTIVNIAMPSAQQDLGFSTDDRQWIVTAYALAFGSLLLPGGRLSDLFGNRMTLMIGLLGFAGASALGGAAPTFTLLIVARVLQGVCAAVLAPAALSTLNLTFTDRAERARAFAIYSAIAAGGAVVGLILGGMLTEWLSWRWCLYVNLVFAVPAAAGVVAFVRGRDQRQSFRIDLPGVVSSSGGLFCLVYALSNAQKHSWSSPLTVTLLVASAVLLTGFVLIERVVASPLLPLRILRDRDRAGSYLSIALAFSTMFGAYLLLTYYLQQGLGFSPIETGLAFLPIAAGVMISAGVANTKLMPRVGPRPLVPTGFVIAAAAMTWLAQLSPTSTYAHDVMGPIFVMGLGIGLAFTPSISTATADVSATDAGVSSAMVNTSQQIGGAIGTAVLSTVFTSALADYLGSHRPSQDLPAAATIHGYTSAFAISALAMVGGAIAAGALLRSGAKDGRDSSSAGVLP